MPSTSGVVLRTVLVVATLFVAVRPGLVQAQDVLRVALFKTASEDADLQSLAAAIDPVLLSELGDVPQLQVAARPALDLPSMQLAVDCVGETAECLAVAAKQAQADGLIAPSVRRAGDEVVVTVLLHDARKQMLITAATRRFSGAQLENQVLDAIASMVDELFGVQTRTGAEPSGAAPQSAGPPEGEPAEPLSPPPTAAGKGWPIAATVVGAAGVALLAVGVGFGLAAKSSEDAYAKLELGRGDVDGAKAAQDKYDAAATQATVANIGLGAGAAALAASVVLFILHASDPRASTSDAATSGPRLSGELGRVTLTGAWD